MLRWVGWGRKGLGIWDRCKLLYRGWINNQFLLYRTGNYIQYPVINHNGKKYTHTHTHTHTHTTESLCCTTEINTVSQLYFNNIKRKKKKTFKMQHLIYVNSQHSKALPGGQRRKTILPYRPTTSR